jgi:hypothetical protein
LIKPISCASAKRETADAGNKNFDPPCGGPPQQETTMKNLILAAIATLSLGIGVANAQSLSHSAPAHSPRSTPNFIVGGDGA